MPSGCSRPADGNLFPMSGEEIAPDGIAGSACDEQWITGKKLQPCWIPSRLKLPMVQI